MHLSSITIKGFKSFPERTQLVFSPGVSVIVGPNGCGKSNITDAVLWALGEQSPLSVRGQTMQDMIYAGGEGIGPSRHAEVEVVLDNEGGDGAIFRDRDQPPARAGGRGQYRLNGARSRLADVIETLSDANLGGEMHSVISQGRVEEIVHSKPRDRRLLVEEAAGLGKHRKRRRRAQLKLERTQDNLDRALDVEREARSRLRPLKRQAQAADIHARLEREAAELRARLLAAELRGQETELAEAERRSAAAREQRAGVDAELAEVTKRRTEIEERLAERDRERTEAWGRLTAVRAAHERLSVRAEALASRRGELALAVERRRAALGALAGELAAAGGGQSTDDPVETGIERIDAALAEAGNALDSARSAGEHERAAELAKVREAADRAAQVARRLEDLLGSRRQDSLAGRLELESTLLAALEALCEAAADARDAAGERAGGARAADARRGRGRRRHGSASRLLARGGRASGSPARDRRARSPRPRCGRRTCATAATRPPRELERIASLVGRELGPAEEPLDQQQRAEIEPSSSAWAAGESSSARSTRSPSASTRRLSPTLRTSRLSAATSRPRSASCKG